jgi:hypothetical protein
MPPERWLEFHDSKLRGIRRVPGGVCVELDAYMHRWEGEGETRRGTGWMQPVQIEVGTSETETRSVATPMEIRDGRVVAASLREDDAGTLTIPVVLNEPVTLELETISGETFRATGTRIELTLLGEPRFVENLPDSMDPEERAKALRDR